MQNLKTTKKDLKKRGFVLFFGNNQVELIHILSLIYLTIYASHLLRYLKLMIIYIINQQHGYSIYQAILAFQVVPHLQVGHLRLCLHQYQVIRLNQVIPYHQLLHLIQELHQDPGIPFHL